MTCSTTAGFEKHRYAPELNRVHLKNGVVLKAPGTASVKEYREKIRGKAQEFMIMAEVKTVYPEPHKWLERTKVGSVSNRKEAIAFRGQVQGQLAPDGKATLRTWIAGA